MWSSMLQENFAVFASVLHVYREENRSEIFPSTYHNDGYTRTRTLQQRKVLRFPPV